MLPTREAYIKREESDFGVEDVGNHITLNTDCEHGEGGSHEGTADSEEVKEIKVETVEKICFLKEELHSSYLDEADYAKGELRHQGKLKVDPTEEKPLVVECFENTQEITSESTDEKLLLMGGF